MGKNRLNEELNAVEKRIASILVGAFCFGDDGEDAQITRFYIGKDGVPMIHFVQDDGCEYDFDLAGYIDSIELDQDEKDEVEDYLSSVNVYESAKPAVRRKLILNEDSSYQGKPEPALVLSERSSNQAKNFIMWSRALLKDAGIPAVDPKSERVYVKEGAIYYLYPGFTPEKARTLQAKLQKYSSRENFPAGMVVSHERGLLAAQFEADGEIAREV